MKKIFVIMVGLLMSASAYAGINVSYESGHVTWNRSCSSGYSFSFFDGDRLQHPCILSNQLSDFQSAASGSDCHGEVEVVSGEINDGNIFAYEIREVWGCGR